MNNTYFYLFFSAVIVYFMRMLPLTLIKGKIRNRFVRSFLYYVPYITLSVMTFPAIVQATQIPSAGLLALVGAITLSYKGASLIQVATVSCLIVFVMELVLV